MMSGMLREAYANDLFADNERVSNIKEENGSEAASRHNKSLDHEARHG